MKRMKKIKMIRNTMIKQRNKFKQLTITIE